MSCIIKQKKMPRLSSLGMHFICSLEFELCIPQPQFTCQTVYTLNDICAFQLLTLNPARVTVVVVCQTVSVYIRLINISPLEYFVLKAISRGRTHVKGNECHKICVDFLIGT